MLPFFDAFDVGPRPAFLLARRRVTPLAVTAYTATTALGRGVEALSAALRARRGGLVPLADHPVTGAPLDAWVGRVAGLDHVTLPTNLAPFDCRQHRLAWLGLEADGFGAAARAAIARLGPARVAVLVGTSTSTIAETEAAYRADAAGDAAAARASLARPDLHHLHATTSFVRRATGATGPAATVSTACSSSAKVFAQAARMIALGIVDAAIVGGVDSLAASTLAGFAALGLVSRAPCRPFDADRDGISIGEAAGFAIVERFDATRHGDVPLLVGYGESSDAHHLSAPHPEGRGARDAIVAALERAAVPASAVDYVNLHGTATPKNDAVEAAVVAALYEPATHAGSTKGWTGHTLGAAGIVEAVVCIVAMRDRYASGTLGCTRLDATCGPQVRIDGQARPIGMAVSPAFAFGGNNAVLAFARDVDAWSAVAR